MKRHKNLIILGTLLLAMSSQISGFNLEHHMYLGANDRSIWQEFDPGFGDYLNFGWPPGALNDTIKLLTTKFYLIGLTLPDLLLPYQQSTCRAMLGLLDSIEAKIDSVAQVFEIPLIRVPFHITGSTYQNVQTEITFPSEPPNSNFQKFWEMAKYAKNQAWSPYEKVLIYGALAHIVQDLYGGTALIPSRYGYGFMRLMMTAQ